MTANEFLKKYFEYKCYWSVRHGTNNKPAEIRRKQLLSVMTAFEISPVSENITDANKTFSFFEKGMFLKGKNNEKRYTELEEKIIEFADKIIDKRYSLNEDWKKNISYQYVFKELLSFRKEIESLYVSKGGIRLEGFGSISEHFSKYQKGKILKALKTEITEVDNVLCLLIDPEKRNFSISVLEEKYGYPKEDLSKISTDWIADGI